MPKSYYRQRLTFTNHCKTTPQKAKGTMLVVIAVPTEKCPNANPYLCMDRFGLHLQEQKRKFHFKFASEKP